MKGSEPPSSSTTFLRWRPATSATAAPARSEPVSETPCTRGSAMTVSICVVRGVDVDVGARREAGVEEDALDGGGRLGALLGVLQEDRVADDEVRSGEAGDLVVREVPRHDAEEHAQRRAADERRAVAGEQRDRLVLEEVGRVVGVVAVDVAGEVDLAEGLLDRLAHLAHDDLGELLAALDVQLADAADEGRALLDGGGLRPRAVGLVGRGDGGVELGVGDGRERLDRLAGGGVGHGIAHWGSPSRVHTRQSLVCRGAYARRTKI